MDPNGNVYVVGTTVSQDFQTTTPVFQPKYGGGNADAFITKLNSTAAALVYSSYLGGTNTESGNGIAIESNPADPTNPGALAPGKPARSISHFPIRPNPLRQAIATRSSPR